MLSVITQTPMLYKNNDECPIIDNQCEILSSSPQSNLKWLSLAKINSQIDPKS